MVSLLETAVRKWRELGLVGNNRHLRETHTQQHNEKTQKQRRKKREKETNYINGKQQKLQQTTLTGENLEEKDNESYGNTMKKKEQNNFRVVSQNIRLLPEVATTGRSRRVVNTISNTEADVFTMTEPTLFWPLVSTENKWFERIVGKFRSHRALFGCNTTEPTKTGLQQYGGVGLVAVDETATRSREAGKDPSGLGRWVWMRFQGRNNHITRVVSVYRPCRAAGKELSVWQQHVRYFRGVQEQDRNPRKAVYEDLYEEAKQWKEQGDHIIIAGDVNEDVRTGQTEEFFKALGMREVILEKHSDFSPPATHNKNNKREPIDGIWATEELQVNGAGYAAFGDGCKSDHRLLWADFSYSTVFGKEDPKIYQAPTKRLRASDPRLVRRYNRKVKSALMKEKLISRAFLIEALAKKNGWSKELEDKYNAIQKRNVEIRKEVEKNLRKLKMGGIPWSPKLQSYRDKIELWSMILKRTKKVKVSLTRIRRWMHKTGEMEALRASQTTANEHLNNAFKVYKKAKKKADNWRNEFLDSLAAARAKANGTTVEAEEKSMKQIERQRRQARNVKRMRKKGQQSSVNMVFETDEEGRHERISKDDIEDACIRENSQRFSQSANTPFMQPPLVNDFGYLAETEAAEQVLRRCYELPDGTDYYAGLLIDQLYCPWEVTQTIPITAEITTAEHIKAWQRQDERTSSEPTGLSFNHYKAASKDPTLAAFDATLRNIPYANGFAPDIWKNITDVEILKKAGVYDIHLMRTIQLMNAELNLNNKKLGRDMMARGEDLKLIAKEQFGSRKQHQSITAALNKRLTMDLLRQKRQAGALCSNDAKSCYDRVVHSVAALSMRRLGVPKNGIKSMFISLQQAAHRIRTAFGVSIKKYGHDREEDPLQGLGQGNGCGPAGWAVVSTPIINLMRAAGFGATFLSAMSVTLIAFVCYAFVDDTDVVHTAQDVNTTGITIMKEMQNVIDHWEGGLRATGGAIVPKKSYWYLIDWIWDKQNWRYATIADIPGDLTIKDTCGTKRVTLQRYDPEIAKETLGVFLAMDGNNREEIIKLRQKTQEFADQIRTGFVNKWDAWYAINSTIMKTLEYPMMATTITEKEWDFIMRPIRQAGLPKIQVTSTFPKVLMYGPKSFHGLGIMHPYLHQELLHVAACIHEGERETITGELIRASTEQLQVELGLPGHIFEKDYGTLAHLATDCWLKTVWNFTWQNDIQIKDTVAKPKLYRDNDSHLMEEIIRHGFQGNELKKINECRMFLNVMNLSEITTVDGKRITEQAWTGIKDDNRINEYQWPRAPPALSKLHWRLWKKAIQHSFVDPMKTKTRELLMPLHDWSANITNNWMWFYSTEDDELYKREGLLWYRYAPTHDTRRRRHDKMYDRVPCPTREVFIEALQTATVIAKDGTAELIAYSQDHGPQSTTIPEPTSSLQALRFKEPASNKWAIAEWDYSQTNLPELIQDIKDKTASAVSDGSFKNCNGTSAFMLCSERLENRIIGVNAVPGAADEQSAYRSELAGVSGIIHILKLLCKKFSIKDGSVQIGLDGDQALKAAAGTWPLKAGQADYDLIKDIRAKIKALPIQITWKWIEGHQDDNEDFRQLDSWAQRNIQCDSLAKMYWNHCLKANKRLPNQKLGDEGWTLWFNSRKRSRVEKISLYSEMYGDEVCDYWVDKGQIPITEIHSIDWVNSEKAIKRLPFSKQLWISKFSSGHCAVGKMMKIRKEWNHDKCPLCLDDNETNEHVLLCQDPRALLHWETLAEKLDKDMQNMTTAPTIRRTIMRKIHKWRNRQPTAVNVTDEYGERDAALVQDRIGWTNFMLGRMASEWASAQQAYLDHLGKRKTGKRWLIAITAKLLKTSWDMWDHRNSILHHKDHPWKQVENNEANSQIDAEYDQGPLNLDEGSQWLRRTSQEVKALPIQAKQQWLRSVELARQPYDRDTVTEYRSMQHERSAMAEWLIPAPRATAAVPRESQAETPEASPSRSKKRPAQSTATNDETSSVESQPRHPRKKQRREELISKKRKRSEEENTSTE